MDEHSYKIRLTNGRVLGPLELERIKLFIANDTITGVESARRYPNGDWKDINSFSEIADLFFQKLEGKLRDLTKDQLKSLEEELKSVAAQPVPPPSPAPLPPTVSMQAVPTKSINEEVTTMMTASDEKTIMYDGGEDSKTETQDNEPNTSVSLAGAQEENGQPLNMVVDPTIAQEKTQMLDLGPQNNGSAKNGTAKRKKLIFVTLLVLAAIVVLLPQDKTKKAVPETPFKVEMPVSMKDADPQQSEKIYQKALSAYAQDTVDGYKSAARDFLKAASLDINNVKAICMLASSYMNLIDVTNPDQNYFNVVTNLIELARAKGVDLMEGVIADVELYLMLGNPDAAMNRIVEFTKTHQFGPELFYYFAQCFYQKGQNADALKYLNNLEPKAWFSAKVPYLYGLVFEKNGQNDDASRAFAEVVRRSPSHVKARALLAELQFKKDSIEEAKQNIQFIFDNKSLASNADLSKAHYIDALILETKSVSQETLKQAAYHLEEALKMTPDDPDIVLELYTVQARRGSDVKGAQGKAKMFSYLAQGKKALNEGHLDEAMSAFLTARDSDYDEPAPLIEIANIFKRKGDLQSAKTNLGKAVALVPQRVDLYPKYIDLLIQAYELTEANKALQVLKSLDAPEATVDRLQGDVYSKQGKLLEANAYYKRALSSSNIDSAVYISYADILFQGNAFKDAAFYYGLALRFDPFNSKATIGIGKSLAETDNVDVGVQYIQAAIPSARNKAALLNGIGELYIRKGDYANALKSAEDALTADPTYALAHKTRGDAYAAQDKSKEALDAYLTYSNLSPMDPSGHIERYKLYMKKLDLKAAKEEMEKVISDFPHYPGAFYMLGELFQEGQNYKSALEAGLKEVEINPGYVPAYVLVGEAYNIGKEYTKALEYLNKALRMDPNFVPALIQAGFANHMLKTYAAAKSLLEKALALDAGNPQIHKRLGSLYYDLGDMQRSRQHYKSYIDLLPDAPDRAEVEKFLNGS